MPVTTSGWCAGDYFDPEHRKVCLRCNSLAWREYRKANPGPLRRLLRRMGDRFLPTGGLPIPPDSEGDSA